MFVQNKHMSTEVSEAKVTPKHPGNPPQYLYSLKRGQERGGKERRRKIQKCFLFKDLKKFHQELNLLVTFS